VGQVAGPPAERLRRTVEAGAERIEAHPVERGHGLPERRDEPSLLLGVPHGALRNRPVHPGEQPDEALAVSTVVDQLGNRGALARRQVERPVSGPPLRRARWAAQLQDEGSPSAVDHPPALVAVAVLGLYAVHLGRPQRGRGDALDLVSRCGRKRHGDQAGMTREGFTVAPRKGS
jgi:hypothetical protein